MTVYVKALGVSRRSNRVIPYRVTIGKFSTVFHGTCKELHEYIESIRYVLSSLD